MFHKKMIRLLAVLALSATLFGCSKDSTPKTSDPMDDMAGMDMSTPEPAASAASAPPASVDSVAAAQKPTLHMNVDVNKDTATVHFDVTNFKISPEHYSQAPVPGEGHIHLFIDGSPTKVAVKDKVYQLDGLSPGHHTLKASLHTNNHQPYNVEDTAEFDVK
ncbi:hypothetical protein [Tumebacillus flagellatus]|uniref:DUF4399 domain-containing protein n=1 Tax=Tumebacillus flagellatus TaxID=1157490 RepID=A0A074LKD0_9BACL|nr:hypothetical protein [Tumebacillus flagellatus]KEO81549.1 hypothetical protein EL26_20340 [Tumebacillus flagellatus]